MKLVVNELGRIQLNNSLHLLRVVSGLIAIAVFGSANQVYAESEVLEEIVVTAQKREQTLQDTSASITAFTADMIDERGLNDTEKLSLATPGVRFQETTGSSQISIRGVGMLVVSGSAESNVATHVDGVFLPRASAPALKFGDLERIEVLRGPQGTLYGRNATGGSINYVSAKPTEEFEGSATLGFGDFGEQTFRGYVSGGLSDTASGRLSIFYDEDDGYYDNIFLDEDAGGLESWGVRGALSFNPTDQLSIDLSVTHMEEDGRGPIQTVVRGTGGVALPFFPGVVVTTEPWETASPVRPQLERSTTLGIAEVNYDFSENLSLKSITGWSAHDVEDQIFDGEGSSLFGIVVGAPGDPRQNDSDAFSQEFNLSGVAADGRFEWLFGLYYFDEDHEYHEPAYFNALAPIFGLQSITTEAEESTESKAAFFDFMYSVTDDLRLGAGIRRTEDTKEWKIDRILGVGVPVFICDDLELEEDFNDTNYRVRGEWDVNENAMLYAMYQTSFKDGGHNAANCGADPFPAEEISAIEVGAKTTLLDGNMTLNVSIFSYDYEDLQYLRFIAPGTQRTDSIPESTIRGGEVELLARLGEGWTVDLGIAFLDSEIDEFSTIDQANPTPAPVSFAGNSLPNSPDTEINAGIEYEWNSNSGTFRARGEVYYSDEYDFQIFDNRQDRQESFTILNFYLGYTSPSERYSVTAYLRNATEEERLNTLFFAPSVGIVGEHGEPRTWGVELNVRF